MLFLITKGPCPRGNYYNFQFNLTLPYSHLEIPVTTQKLPVHTVS